jgi:DNA-binding XRE family transcriptional regulator
MELEIKGWKFGGAEEFLDLRIEELEYIDLKIALGEMVRAMRVREGLSQAGAAEILKLSQAHLVKIETADPAVSIDMQIKSLLALGATKQEIGQKIAF